MERGRRTQYYAEKWFSCTRYWGSAISRRGGALLRPEWAVPARLPLFGELIQADGWVPRRKDQVKITVENPLAVSRGR
jgi:hypothetical protein